MIFESVAMVCRILSLERQLADRISFMKLRKIYNFPNVKNRRFFKFLGFPETIPDYTTVWYFRERLAKTGNDEEIWVELQRQLDENDMKV
ncbi:MAG: hypothetical protein BME94_08665, partial [Methanobacteriales archaeon Met13]